MTKKIIGGAFILGIVFGIIFLIKWVPIFLAVSDMETKMSECISNFQQYTAAGCKNMFRRIIDKNNLQINVDEIKIDAAVQKQSTITAEWVQTIDFFGVWEYKYACKATRSGRVPDRM